VQLKIDALIERLPLMSETAACHSATHAGSDFLGWLHFQPVYDQVVAANLDMFD
jgi:hypothetical protein